MLATEITVGNYMKSEESKLGLTNQARENVVQFMEELQQTKKYQEMTFHIAVNIVDRYL